MSEQGRLIEGVPTDAEHEADLRAREADYTPRGVVRQILREAYALELSMPRPRPGRALRVLDWCAGAGVWSSEMRALARDLGFDVEITAVEIDERERPHLERWADRVWIGDARGMDRLSGFDLVIGNPAFSLLADDVNGVRMLLGMSPAILVLHTIEALHRSARGRELARTLPPAAQFDIGGSISFRGPGRGADMRSYCAWLWLRSRTGPGWRREVLPDLPASDRAWKTKPGTEPKEI